MTPYTYISHAITGQVVVCFGQGERADRRAIDYALRRYALQQYLAMRNGFAPTASEPLIIVHRTGRPLAPGALVEKSGAGLFKTPVGFRHRRQGQPPQEAICVLPAVLSRAVRELATRYPKTWARYESI